MGIFDRLSRLARAEANHLLDSAADAAGDVFGGEGRERARPEAPPAAPEASDLPQEVAEDYAALELPLGADREAVKEAYRDLMRRYHPDRHSADSDKSEIANELTVRIRQSYERLDAYLQAQAR